MKPIFWSFIAVAGLVSSTMALVQAEPIVNNLADPAKSGSILSSSRQLADEATASHARVLLSHAVNNAAAQGQFENLVALLAKADRDRIGVFKHEEMAEFNRVIAQFRVDFEAKYHQDFDIKPDLFRDALIYAGKDERSAEVSFPALRFDNKTIAGGEAVSATPPAAKTPADKPLADPKPPAAPTSAQPLPAPDSTAAISKAAGGVKLNLINEGTVTPSWRINIANQVGAVELKANLQKRIQALDDDQANWPATADAGFRAAAYQILQGLTDGVQIAENKAADPEAQAQPAAGK